MSRGDRSTVVSAEGGQVVLRMADEQHQLFLPERLPRNLTFDAVSGYTVKEVQLHAGDRIRWTDSDHGRELLNAQLARVEKVGAEGVIVSSLVHVAVHELAREDRMLEPLDLGYALNVHVAHGVTTDRGIAVMSAHHKPLASQSLFLVEVARIADKATLVVDSGRDTQLAVQGNSAQKTAAPDVSALP